MPRDTLHLTTMSVCRASLFFWILLLFFPIQCIGTPGLEVLVSSAKVSTLESLEITFTIYDAENARFEPPNLGDFEVLSGPSTRISADLKEGKVQSSKSYGYILRPKRVGTLHIGSATATTGGRQFISQPLQILSFHGVIQPRGSVFAEARLSTTRVYPGQPLWLDLVVFCADSSWTVQSASLPEIPGMVGERCAELTKGYAKIKGKTWFSSSYRIKLFPQQSGEFIVPEFQFDILEWRRDAYSPFGHHIKRQSVATRPINLSVSALPANAPPDFSGSTGQWAMHANWVLASVKTGETALLNIVIEGEGDSKRLKAPRLLLPEWITAFQPKILENRTNNPCQHLKSSVTYQYPLVADRRGNFSVEAHYNYFDTRREEYVNLKIKTPEFQIGKDSVSAVVPLSKKEKLFPINQKNLLIGIGTLLLIGLGWKFWPKKEKKLPESLEPAQCPKPVNYLSRGLPYLERRNPDAFFKTLSEALLQELSRKTGRVVSRADITGLTKEHLIPEPLMQKLIHILKTADYFRYSGANNVDIKLDEWYDLALEVLKELEKDE